jgi:hypothetical protein
MRTAAEYREQARQCRTIAKGMPDGIARQQLVIMAETWDRLAEHRESKLQLNPNEAPKEPAKGQPMSS